MVFTEIAAIILSALGGGSIALGLFIKFGANKIADMIFVRYQNKLDKNLETHKAKVEIKNHVTKLRFDKEFEILHHLVSEYYDFTYLTWDVYLSLGIAEDGDFDSSYAVFIKACDEYTIFFYKNSAVISKDLANTFEIGIKKLNDFRFIAKHCRKQYIQYNGVGKTDTDGFQTHVVDNAEKLRLIHDELNSGNEYGVRKIIDLVRTYLDSLEII